ncbi:MAG: TPM domain-containing protein [Chloroflexia bacterium]|nr:TPM domain-containing protein [Chloroflexia bacterium]
MTVPVPTTRAWRAIVVRPVMIVLLIGMLSGALFASGPIDANAGVRTSLQATPDDSIPPRAPESTTFVYDEARILASTEAERHQFDLGRLWQAGIPTIIYTRRSNDSREQAVAFADRLREEWALESSPGADDGIVMLVSLHESSRRENALVLSTGAHALPINQLTSERFRDIRAREMQPAFRRNEINLALSFGVRRMLYYEGYTPPDPPPLTDRQVTARALVPSALLLAGTFAIGTPLIQRGRAPSKNRWGSILRSRGLYRAGIVGFLTLAAGLALYGRSGPWLVVSVLGGIVLMLGVRFARAWREWRQPEPAVLRVAPRSRRFRQPPVLAHRPPRVSRHV